MKDSIEELLNDDLINHMMGWIKGIKLEEDQYYFLVLKENGQCFYGAASGDPESTAVLTSEDGENFCVKYCASMDILDKRTDSPLEKIMIFNLDLGVAAILTDKETIARMVTSDSQISLAFLSVAIRETMSKRLTDSPDVITVETLSLIDGLAKELRERRGEKELYIHCVIAPSGSRVFSSDTPPAGLTGGVESEYPNEVNYVGALKLQDRNDLLGTIHIHKEIKQWTKLKAENLH